MHTKSPTLVFHIGFHKTGSTSLQQFFAENETALQLQGIRFPSAAREENPRQIIHSNLPWQLLKHGKFDQSLGSLEDIAREVHIEPRAVWTVTTEGLSRLTDISSIKRCFPDADIKTIAYCRNPLYAAPSLYTEHLKFGTTKTWSDWANPANLREWFDYKKKLGPWQALSDEVALRHLTEERKVEESGLTIFEDFLGLLPVKVQTCSLNMSCSPEANTRLSVLECAALYAVNHALKTSAEAFDENNKTAIRNAVRRVVRRLFSEFLYPFTLNTSQQKKLQDILFKLGYARGATRPLDSPPEKTDEVANHYSEISASSLRKVFRRHLPRSLNVKTGKVFHFLKDVGQRPPLQHQLI